MRKYTVTFFDKSTLIVGEIEAEKIQGAIARETKHFKLKENLYATSAIAKIERNKVEEVPMLSQGSGDPVKKETLSRLKKEFAKKFDWK